MSNIYIQEPPALGKVLLKTTVGDIDIELWTKEAPKACRNFIQLCMEGYYNGTIFHRVIPEFMVQGGDPNGDGTGGESIYGAPFKDEFHSRLRFNRRGLVASANAGKDDNGSQFFITLAATPELQNKHTIFGKITGETIYNVLKLSDGLIGPNDRPEHPHKVIATNVLINPFTDIVPRVVKRDVVEVVKKKKEKVGVKNFGLLSFGAEAEEEEGEALEWSGKPKSTHDLLEDPRLSRMTAAELEAEQKTDTQALSQEEIEAKNMETKATVSNIRDKLNKKRESSLERDSKKKKIEVEEKKEEEDSSSEEEYYLGKERDLERQKERDRIRNEIKQLKKEMKGTKQDAKGTTQDAKGTTQDTKGTTQDTKGTKESTTEKKETEDGGSSMLEEETGLLKDYVEEQEKYKKIKEKMPKKGAARENFTLQLLAKFKNKLQAIKEKSLTEDGEEKEEEGEQKDEDEDEFLNGDDWLGHTLRFENKGAVLAKDASTKSDDWFDIYDPRNPINKRKRENKDKTSKRDK